MTCLWPKPKPLHSSALPHTSHSPIPVLLCASNLSSWGPLWLLLAIFSYPSIFPSRTLLQLKLKSMARTSLLLRSSQDKYKVRSRQKPAFLCFHDGASPFLPPSPSPSLKYVHGISPSSPHPHPQLSGEGLDPFFTFCEDLGTSPQSPLSHLLLHQFRQF